MEHVVYAEGITDAYNIFFRKILERDYLGDLGIGGILSI
jgi:hypothetical protein